MEVFYGLLALGCVVFVIWMGVSIFGAIFGRSRGHGKEFTPEQCTDPLCVASRRGILTGGHPETNQAILSAAKSMASDVVSGPIVRSTDTGTTDTLEHTYTKSSPAYAPGKAEMGFDKSVAITPPLSQNPVNKTPAQLQDANGEWVTLPSGIQVQVTHARK